ncbi:HUTH-like protein [Mya arenaria]|uniref:HUTH-like protein n=1 Tax=Mya arenaria TaxID=6604 RepID=A0ABY7FS96_MYAAR|nr:HUTH-like protein [Mya arenaria]
MKLSVRIRGDWFAVPCKATDKIAWFGEEALRRYYRKKNLEGTDRREKVFEVRKAKGGAILDPSDSIRDILDDNDFVTVVVYGITTGFGKFARTVIGKEKLVELQENLIRSHAAGVGNPLSPERTRMLLALRINVLAKGYSGISPENLKNLVPALGSGKGDGRCKRRPGAPVPPCPGDDGGGQDVLESNNLEPIKLGPKEGLALINGTQLITSLGAEAVERSDAVCRQADVIAALSLEVLKGTTRAFDSNIHRVRPHPGQISVARRIRSLLHSETYPSEIAESHRFCDRVQDAYTLRCLPQVHGIVKDTVDFVRGVLTTELNSATDNPMVFAEQQEIISGGNFHGEYPAKVLDYLAIGVHELANISERRIERLVNPAYSELPAFLTQEGGLNSGFMIAHCTAAALVSENKVLCHPASVDSLTTSAGTEDHVSMGGFAARKAVTVVEHVEQVLAIELLCACQAIEFLRPLKPWIKDRYMAPDIDAVTKLIQDEKVWHTVKPLIENYHATQVIETRVLSPTTAMRTEGPAPKRRRVASERKGK